jgi:RNA polymerase sigma factor (sigma-70 family)
MAGGQLRTFLRHLHCLSEAHGGGLSDAQLLERFVANRDEAAFEVLLWRHGPLVLSVCRRVLRQEQDAEDAFQASFLVLARKACTIGKRQAVGSWLYKVAYRIALAARRRRPMPSENAAFESLAATPGPDPVWSNLRPLLDEEVSRLPEKYRTPLILCYLEGKTHTEAAAELGCPKGTIAVRLKRGRERLRLRLVKRGVTLSAGALAVAVARDAAALVPAALVGATLRAALTSGSGKTAAVGAVSGPAAVLAEGAIRAMWMTKVTMAAAVLLAVGVVGSGTGLLTFRGPGAEQPFAKNAEEAPAGAAAHENEPDEPQQDKALEERREKERQERALQERQERERQERALEDRRAKERQLQHDRAQADLEKLDDQSGERERAWTEELIRARKKLVTLEETLRVKERLHAALRDHDSLELDTFQREIKSKEEAIQRTTAELAKVRETVANPEDLSKLAKRLEDRAQTEKEQLQKERQALRRLSEEVEAKWSAELIDLRQEMVTAEEGLRLLERQQATQRQRFETKREAAEDRLRQLEGLPLRGEPTNRGLAELEKKIEALQREVSDLRRELRRQP